MYTHSVDMKGTSVVDWDVGKTLVSDGSALAVEMTPLVVMDVSEIELWKSIEEGDNYECKRSSAP